MQDYSYKFYAKEYSPKITKLLGAIMIFIIVAMILLVSNNISEVTDNKIFAPTILLIVILLLIKVSSLISQQKDKNIRDKNVQNIFINSSVNSEKVVAIINKELGFKYFDPELFGIEIDENITDITSFCDKYEISSSVCQNVIKVLNDGVERDVTSLFYNNINQYNLRIFSSGDYVVLTLIPSPNIRLSRDDYQLDDLWQDYFTDIPISVAIIDVDGFIKKSNNNFITLSKNKNNLEGFLGQNSLKNAHKILSGSVVAGGVIDKVDVRFNYDKESTATLYVKKIGNSDNYLCIIVDKTEKKHLQEQFVQSQKMQAVGQLAGGIAHDFNNLLTAMMGFCDLLLTRHRPGEQSFADIMQIKQNANRAANLVSQLLAFSRKQTLQPKAINLNEDLSDISNLIRRLIGHNIQLDIAYTKNLWNIKADKVQIEQVVINMAVNARDAINAKFKQEGGEIYISTRNVTVDENYSTEGFISPETSNISGDYVVLDVQDNGSGMSEATIKKVFEPFFTTKGVGKGTGLGLSTVYGIINQTGGAIYVKSIENEGTNFNIYLPRDNSVKEVNTQQNIVVNDQSPMDLTGTATVLIVEDEAPVRMFSSRALSNKGYKVIEAASGDEAYEMLNDKSLEIDIIVSDVMMPGRTGPDFVKAILPQYPDVKVVFISGYGEDAFKDTFGGSRDFNFLPKPFSLKDLVSKVKDVLDS